MKTYNTWTSAGNSDHLNFSPVVS